MLLHARRLALNFVLLSGGEAASKLLAFLAFAYLARLLGPDTYGDLEFALAVTVLFTLVVEGGLGLLGAREIAKEEAAVRRLTFHIVILRCWLAVGAFALLVFVAIYSDKSWQEKQLVILFGLSLFGTPGLLQWVFQGLDRMQWIALASVLRWLIFSGLVFLCVSDPGRVWLVPLIDLGAIGSVVALNFGVFRHHFGRFRQPFDSTFARRLLRGAIPIGLTQVMWGLKVYTPTVMLGLMVGGEAVGWFGAAHRIVIALHTFVWMYFFNLYPSIARCTQQQSSEALDRLVGKSLQVTSWSAIFIGVVGAVFARPLLNLMYGPLYDDATNAFQVLVWLVAFSLLSSHYMYTLIAYGKQWLELLSAVLGAVLNIPLSYVLILQFGLLGAALSLLITEAAVWTLNVYFVRRHIAALPFVTHLIRPVIVGAALAALMAIIPPLNVLIIGCGAILLYAVGMLIVQPSIVSDVRVLIVGNR